MYYECQYNYIPWGCHADTMEHSYTNSMVWVVIYGYDMGMDGTDMVLFSPTYTQTRGQYSNCSGSENREIIG